MNAQLTPAGAAPPSARLAAGQLLQVLVTFLVIGGILFAAAGRVDWPAAWIFLIVYILITLVTAWWMLRTEPGLARERAQPGQNVKSWDNLLVGFNLLLSLALFAVIGLDAGRYGWSAVSPWVRVLGWVGLIPAFGLPLWATRVNAYLSSRVRIQEDRGHTVVAEGPYRHLRHPMYAGMICYNVSVPLVLGSWWGLAVGAAMIALVILRTALEDRTLRRELQGYDAYSRQVRYRLLPGVW